MQILKAWSFLKDEEEKHDQNDFWLKSLKMSHRILKINK